MGLKSQATFDSPCLVFFSLAPHMQPSTMMLILTVFAVLLPITYTKRETCQALEFKVGMGALLPNETRELLWNASVYVFEDDPIAFYKGYPKLGTNKQFYAVCVLYWEWRGEPFHCGKVMWNGRSSRAKEITLEQFKSFYDRCSDIPLPPLDLKKRPVKNN